MFVSGFGFGVFCFPSHSPIISPVTNIGYLVEVFILPKIQTICLINSSENTNVLKLPENVNVLKLPGEKNIFYSILLVSKMLPGA